MARPGRELRLPPSGSGSALAERAPLAVTTPAAIISRLPACGFGDEQDAPSNRDRGNKRQQPRYFFDPGAASTSTTSGRATWAAQPSVATHRTSSGSSNRDVTPSGNSIGYVIR